jgi:hypothetical protein
LDSDDEKERARIRAILNDYMAEKGIRLPKLFKRICAARYMAERNPEEDVGFSFKTFQRLMSAKDGDKAVAVCARFVERLPHRPTVFHALGEALNALYKVPLPPDIAGSYNLVSNNLSTQISISTPSDGFALASEKHTSPIHRLHDGVMVSTAPGEYLILLRDRMMLSPRYVATHGEAAFVYDHARTLYPGHPTFNYAAVFARA